MIIFSIVIAGLLIIAFLKFRNSSIFSMEIGGTSSLNASNDTFNVELKSLAEKMGLNYEDASIKTSEKMLLNTGSRLFGNYKNVSMEIIMGGYAKQSANTPLTSSFSYEYKITKEFRFEVANPKNHFFELTPKNKNIVSRDTGVFSFDSQFSYVGDMNLPESFLNYVAQLGWMNLKLKNNQLTFTDSFFEDTMASKGAHAALDAINPVWKCTSRNFTIDSAQVISFIDALIELINQLEIHE